MPSFRRYDFAGLTLQLRDLAKHSNHFAELWRCAWAYPLAARLAAADTPLSILRSTEGLVPDGLFSAPPGAEDLETLREGNSAAKALQELTIP